MAVEDLAKDRMCDEDSAEQAMHCPRKLKHLQFETEVMKVYRLSSDIKIRLAAVFQLA